VMAIGGLARITALSWPGLWPVTQEVLDKP